MRFTSLCRRLTVVRITLLRAGFDLDRLIAVVLCSRRSNELVFVHNEPVLEVASSNHDLVVVPGGPLDRPGLAVVRRVAVGGLSALEVVVGRVPLVPLVDVPHPVPLSLRPGAHPAPDILGSGGAGLQTGGA